MPIAKYVRSHLRAYLQVLVVLLVLAFWARALARNWDQVTGYPWRLSWPSLALALAVLLVQMILLATIWWRALALTGAHIPWHWGLAVWLQAQIARYVPGGIWDIAGRLALGQQVGVGRRAMSASVGLEMGLQVLSAALILAVSLLFWPGRATAYLPVALVVSLAALLVLTPPVFTRLVNRGLRLLGRQPLDLRLTYGDLMALFLARVLAHGLLGLGFVLFAQGLTPVPWSLAPLLAGAYVGAWLVGYLAILVPTGIGVREGVLVLLLGGYVPFGVATAAALGYRVWIALRDLLAAMLGVWLARGRDTDQNKPSPHSPSREGGPPAVSRVRGEGLNPADFADVSAASSCRPASNHRPSSITPPPPTTQHPPGAEPPGSTGSAPSGAQKGVPAGTPSFERAGLAARRCRRAGQQPNRVIVGTICQTATSRRSPPTPHTSVLFLSTNYARDEGDYHSPWLRGLARRLQSRGLQVTVLAPAFRGLGSHHIDGIPVRRFRYAPARWETLTHESGAPTKLRAHPLYWTLLPAYLLAGTVATLREARRGRYDVLHVHWPVPQALFAQVARWARPARLVLTFYGADVALARRFPPVGRAVQHWVNTADAVTAISAHTARALADVTGVQPQVIPFGVELPERGSLSPPLQGTHRILTVGRLIERKGYPVLLHAVTRLLEQFPDVHLTIVGEGHERPRLERLIRELGLEKAVHLAGRVSNEALDALYREADIFVLPSLVDRSGDTEGLGMVLLEALSYGRPVVASAVGGITDIVQDAETGLLVPPGDPHALAEAIRHLFDDPQSARALANRGWAINRQRFDWERIADAYAALYEESGP